MKYPMTIEQTVEIPADHRLIIEVPPEIPEGRAILAFTPAAKTTPHRHMSVEEALEMGRGIAKRMGSRMTGDLSLERRHEDKEIEEAKYQRMFHKAGGEA
jgi:hypothetical protein